MKAILFLTPLLTAADLLVPLPGYARQAAEQPESQGTLATAQRQEQRLAAGAAHAWVIPSETGRYIEVEVEQQDLDLMVQIVTPTGAMIRSFDGTASETERARWVTHEEGAWQVHVVPFEPDAEGAYAITWTTNRAAEATDRQLAASDSLYDAANLRYTEGRMEDAEALYRQTLELRDTVLGPDHPDSAELLNNLALFYYEQDRMDAVEPLLKRALAAREKGYGPRHREVAGVLANLATFYAAQSRHDEALPLHRRVVDIYEQTDGPAHLNVANALNQLGNTHLWLGSYDEAVRTYERALQIKEQVLAPNDPNLASTLNNIAYVKVEQGHFAEAEPFYERALGVWERSEDPGNPQVALVLDNLAQVYHWQGRYAAADSLYGRALTLKEETLGPDHAYVATTLNNRALVYVDQGRHEEAEPMYRRALAIQDSATGRMHPDYATALDNLALLYDAQGRYTAADSLYRQALELREQLFSPDHPEITTSLNNVGLLYQKQGRYDEAEAMLNRAITIREQALGTDHPGLAINLHNLATLFEEQGRYAEAEPVYRRALAIMEASLGPNHESLASVLTNLANLYTHQSRYAEAEVLLERALAIREAAFGRIHPDVALTLNVQGMVHFFQRRHDRAVTLTEEALAIQQQVFGPDHPSIARLYTNLGEIRLEQGRNDEAEQNYRQGLDLLDRIENTAPLDPKHGLLGLARVYLRAEREDLRPALDWINRAIDLLDATTGYPRWRVAAYTARAQLLKRSGRPDEALDDLEEALRSTEEIRAQIGGGEDVRARFLAPYTRHFDRMVDWQVKQGDIEAAFEYAERGRARVLLDQLAAGRVDLRAGIPADIRAALELRETRTRTRLAELQQRITRLRARSDLPTVERLRGLAALNDSLGTADDAYRQIYRDLKNASPLWRDMMTVGGEPTNLATVQRGLVPPGGLLLLFQIGHEQSYVFAVPPRGEDAAAFPLVVNEAQAGVLQVTPGPLTSGLLQAILGVDEAGTQNGLLKQLAARRGEATALNDKLHALQQTLFPGDLWAGVREASEALIVPDDLLHYLPFEALVVQPGTLETVRYWLDDGPVIRYAPSATTLYNITRRPAPRATPRSGEATVLSLSDALFNPEEVTAMLAASGVRFRGEQEEGRPGTEATRNSYDRAGGSLARLPGTAGETEAIRAAYGSEADRAVLALQGLEAAESNLRAGLAGKRYLHFGTHGLVDERRGALFASLAMTPPAGETAVLEDDGFLQLHEIYELNLPEVELAVLSACESNVGPNVEGEGVFALSRGFFAAGARRVIASQWPVDDASTAALMGAFFDRVVTTERAGRPVDYAHALREARREVRRQPQWSKPFYWAPFILSGKR